MTFSPFGSYRLDFIEKGITEFCLVCCKSVQRSGDFSGFFVYCRQKQLRRVLHPLAHALFGARLIRRKARQLNGNALFHFILADGSKFISFHFMVFLHCPLKKLQKTVFHGKLIERGFLLIQIVIIFSGPQIDRQTVERKAFFLLIGWGVLTMRKGALSIDGSIAS